MRSPSFVNTVVRRHITLPVKEDLAALKVVLRDWVTYTEHVPLQQKPTFTAELHIAVSRDAPTDELSNADAPPSDNSSGGRFLARYLQKINPESGHRRAHSPSRRSPSIGGRGGGSALHVHHKVVPLALWSAVLPWEVQRGLSLSRLALPTHAATAEEAEPQSSGEASDRGVHEAAAAAAQRQDGGADDDDVEDVLGVVSAPAGKTSAKHDIGSVLHSRPAVAPSPPAPGMLFVMDTAAVKAHGDRITFWSGAITQAIDVLFAAPSFAAAVAPSTSFGALRQQRSRERVVDLHEVPEVQARFFPHGEMQQNTTAELRVTNFGHLDPFPHMRTASAAPTGAPATAEERSADTTAAHTVEAVTPEARYVVETTRHLLRDRVRVALAESRAEYAERFGVTVADDDDGDGAVDIQLTLELSDDLKRDIEEKAQLMVQYVQPLEEVIHSHVKRLNTPLRSAAEEEPLAPPPPHGSEEGAGTSSGDRKVRVWLSETESVWMTAGELAAHQAELSRRSKETPREALRRHHAQQQGDTRVDEAAMSAEADEEDDEDNAAYLAEHAQYAGAASSQMQVAPTSDASSTPTRGPSPLPSLSPADMSQRSIARQSPMLKHEEEGRPAYLVPSFKGSHESSALREQGIVVSANKLARYPQTRSGMPVLPPIDYDLFDLTVRLGVGFQSVLFHYHPRILRVWRRELRALQQLARERRGDKAETRVGESEELDERDVMIMLRLVRDPSLQLPEDLITLVEAVADLKEQLHGRPLG